MKFNNQEEIDNQFQEYCKSNDLDSIKKLCNPNPKKSLLSSFFKKFNHQFIVNFFSNSSISMLCKNGNTEILFYILNHPNFQSQLLDTKNSTYNIKTLTEGCFSAAKNGHIKTAELLTVFINQPENDMTEAYFEFVEACEKGNLGYVKFLTTNPDIKDNVNYTINHRLGDFQPINEAFIKACYYGHLDIIKYLLTDENIPNVNLSCIEVNPSLYIDSPEIIQYFIFDFNIPKSHAFLSKIVSPENLTEDLLDKRDFFEKMEKELNKKEEKNPTKKLKI